MKYDITKFIPCPICACDCIEVISCGGNEYFIRCSACGLKKFVVTRYAKQLYVEWNTRKLENNIGNFELILSEFLEEKDLFIEVSSCPVLNTKTKTLNVEFVLCKIINRDYIKLTDLAKISNNKKELKKIVKKLKEKIKC